MNIWVIPIDLVDFWSEAEKGSSSGDTQGGTKAAHAPLRQEHPSGCRYQSLVRISSESD